uniref:Nucleolar protein 16 n=1 Tax=Glossina morsitans morsitans TaxID=37546 RepID=A0A1B0FHW8_GLOMM
MKIRKVHRRKRYRYNVNRKALNRKHKSTGKIKDPFLKTLWEDRKKPRTNFKEMGLSVNPNKTIAIPNYRAERLKLTKFINGFVEEEMTEEELLPLKPKRGEVVGQLEELAKEKADSKLREKEEITMAISREYEDYGIVIALGSLQHSEKKEIAMAISGEYDDYGIAIALFVASGSTLPKGVVQHLIYFLDKYQFNYKAMVMDRRNHYQWTWKQFRSKIKQFMSIPEQFNKYLLKKNLPINEKLPWPEYESDSEWK